jgi:hypothetical protein
MSRAALQTHTMVLGAQVPWWFTHSARSFTNSKILFDIISITFLRANDCATRVAEEVKCREEKATRSQCELRRVLEGLAVQLSSPARFVDAQEESIRERIRELQHECKERSVVRDYTF